MIVSKCSHSFQIYGGLGGVQDSVNTQEPGSLALETIQLSCCFLFLTVYVAYHQSWRTSCYTANALLASLVVKTKSILENEENTGWSPTGQKGRSWADWEQGKQMRVIRMKGRGTGCFVEICLKFVKICCIIVDQMIWIMTGVFWVSGYKVFAC